MTYQVADGANNAGALVALSFQPRIVEELEPAETNYYGMGDAEGNGKTTQLLEWTTLSVADRDTVLTELGLSASVRSNRVTIRTKAYDDSYANYNAIVALEQIGQRELGLIKNLRVRVTILLAL